VLYICIPTHDEAPTIGVLLWRIRTLFQETSREYEVVVYDDGSTDATPEVLEPYAKVLPLTILGARERRGYAASVDALCRHVARHTRYPRRDALILMQGDFTDSPEHIPELVKRFEGGADVVVAQHHPTEKDPQPVRRLRQLTPWILRPFVRVEGVSDLTSTMRLFRVAVVRDLIRRAGDAPIVREEGWSANVELLLGAVPFARRVEGVELDQRFDVRPRPSRRRPGSDALALARFAWRARGRAAVPGSALRAATPPPGDAATPQAAERTPGAAAPVAVASIAPAVESAGSGQPTGASPEGGAPPRRRRSRSRRGSGATRRAAGGAGGAAGAGGGGDQPSPSAEPREES
jgi:hypothetical protein